MDPGEKSEGKVLLEEKAARGICRTGYRKATVRRVVENLQDPTMISQGELRASLHINLRGAAWQLLSKSWLNHPKATVKRGG